MLPCRYALAILFTGLAFGQTQDKTFYLSHPTSEAEMNGLMTMVRTIADIQNISTDRAQNAILTGKVTVDQSMATDWLLNQVYQQESSPKVFRMSGAEGDIVRVFRFDPTVPATSLTALVTAIRTVVDAQRIFPFASENSVIVRTSSAKMAATEWLIAEAIKPATDSVTKSSEYVYTDDRGPEVIKVIHMPKGATNADLTGMVTSIRTVADAQRLFPMEFTRALMMRSTAERIAVAEWMVDQLTQSPTDAAAPHQTSLAGQPDNVVRIFYLNHRKTNRDLTALITELRTGASLQRLFPYEAAGAIVMRGRPDQVSLAQSLVAKFDQ